VLRVVVISIPVAVSLKNWWVALTHTGTAI